MTVRKLAVVSLVLLLFAACGTEEDPAGSAGQPTTEPDVETAPTPEDTVTEGTPEPAGTETETEDGTGADPTDTTDEGETSGGFAPVVVEVGRTDLGGVLVDGAGMTLYLFDNDSDGESSCYDQCAVTWPPLLGSGAEAGDGLDESLFGVTERTDGAQQITYAGHPLYYFAGDSAAGDVAGQGIQDVWWVVSPEGEAVHEAGGEVGSNPYDY